MPETMTVQWKECGHPPYAFCEECQERGVGETSKGNYATRELVVIDGYWRGRVLAFRCNDHKDPKDV